MRNGVLSENKEVAQDDKVANKEPQVRMLKYDKKRLCNPDTFDLVPLSLSNTAAVLKCISGIKYYRNGRWCAYDPQNALLKKSP